MTDYHLISGAARETDEMHGQGPQAIIGRFADPESVMNVAQERTEIVTEGIKPELAPVKIWIDGFLTGARYRELRDDS